MISFIIVDYLSMEKTFHYIDQCKESILDVENLHFIIVDNAPDGKERIEEIDHHGLQILYVKTGENLGYAKGNNWGAAIAREYYQDEYYLFSNNDLKFQKQISMEELLRPMEDSRIAVVGPMITSPQGEQQSPRREVSAFRQLILYYWDLLLPKGCKITRWITDVVKTDQSQESFWVTGSFMAVRADSFQVIEGFDPHTFLFSEEIILSERFRKKGYKTYFNADVKLIHEHGQTMKKSIDVLRQIQVSFQSSLYYYTRYRGISSGLQMISRFNFRIFRVLFTAKKKLKNKPCS
ncbi:MAG: glycosyltransferase [Lachnospiraceae bacterium]|nr:glycosyltransferase [Lachnospiraceae bacterium]